MTDELSAVRDRLRAELADVPLPVDVLAGVRARRHRRRVRVATAAATAAVLVAGTAVAVPATGTTGRLAALVGIHDTDCFSPPPDDRTLDTLFHASRLLHEQMDVGQTFVDALPSEVSGVVVTGPHSIAVGFRDHGCRHLAELAAAVPGGRADVSVFRAPHTAREVRAFHERVDVPTDVLLRLDITSYGGDPRGYELFTVSKRSAIAPATAYLTRRFGRSWFRVSEILRSVAHG